MVKGRISSVQTFGTVDGPGIRFVLFMQGCPLKCPYCHNPETHDPAGGSEVTVGEITDRFLRYSNYYKNGGITVSGGEALMQSDFVYELFSQLKSRGVHTAVDTSGCVLNESVKRMLSVTDLVLLDIKFVSRRLYDELIGVKMERVISFLEYLDEKGIETVIRQVIVKGLNDDEASVNALREITARYSCIKKTELLPFKKLCLEKYEEMGLKFPFEKYQETDEQTIERLSKML